MDTSIKALEEALSIRRQIDKLEKRLSSILSGKVPVTPPTESGGSLLFGRDSREAFGRRESSLVKNQGWKEKDTVRERKR
jgi:hypothetical protein